MDEPRRIPLEEFGEAFLAHVVTTERIRASLERAAGKPFEVPALRPIALAPIVVRGAGRVTAVQVDRAGTRGDYGAEIRVTTELVIAIAGIEHRYAGEIAVRLHLHVMFLEPLTLFVEIDRPKRGDIDVQLTGDTNRAELLKVLGNIRAEVGREVARIVNRQVDSERGLAARRIDIAGAVDAAWASLGRKPRD
jgi:hypothetical protein